MLSARRPRRVVRGLGRALLYALSIVPYLPKLESGRRARVRPRVSLSIYLSIQPCRLLTLCLPVIVALRAQTSPPAPLCSAGSRRRRCETTLRWRRCGRLASSSSGRRCCARVGLSRLASSLQPPASSPQPPASSLQPPASSLQPPASSPQLPVGVERSCFFDTQN